MNRPRPHFGISDGKGRVSTMGGDSVAEHWCIAEILRRSGPSGPKLER